MGDGLVLAEYFDDSVDVGFGVFEERLLHLAEFVYSELEVSRHLREVLVVLFIEYLDELFDDYDVEVVNAVFEYVDALVLEYGVVGQCLINASVLREQFGVGERSSTDAFADVPVGHLFSQYFLRRLHQFLEILASLGCALDVAELSVRLFERFDYLHRRELRAVEDQRALLDQSEQVHRLIDFMGVLLHFGDEFLSQDAVGGKTELEHALEFVQRVEHLFLLVVVAVVLGGRDVTGFELSLGNEFNVFLDVLEIPVQLVQEHSEFMIARL